MRCYFKGVFMAKHIQTKSIQEGFTVWITGLPFSGKKDTGRILAERLDMIGYSTKKSLVFQKKKSLKISAELLLSVNCSATAESLS
jgi:hypothetical protein